MGKPLNDNSVFCGFRWTRFGQCWRVFFKFISPAMPSAGGLLWRWHEGSGAQGWAGQRKKKGACPRTTKALSAHGRLWLCFERLDRPPVLTAAHRIAAPQSRGRKLRTRAQRRRAKRPDTALAPATGGLRAARRCAARARPTPRRPPTRDVTEGALTDETSDEPETGLAVVVWGA